MQQKFKQIGVVEETFDEKEVKSGALESCACILRRVRLFVTLWTVTHQAPLSVGFSRQEYWSGLPCPPPGDLPNPGIEPVSLMSPALTSGLFTIGFTWESEAARKRRLSGDPLLGRENVSSFSMLLLWQWVHGCF